MAASFLRLSRRAWLHLLVYALVVVGHLAFVQAPGAVAELERSVPLTPPEGYTLVDIAPLADARHALASLSRKDGGPSEIWLINWGRIDEVVDGRSRLEQLALATTKGEWLPRQVGGQAGAWTWLERRDNGLFQARWAPPATPSRRPLPDDTLWVDGDGAIDAVLINEGLAKLGAGVRRVLIEPALLVPGFALLRPAAAGDDHRPGSGLLVADRRGWILQEIPAPTLFMIAASPFRSRFYYTNGLDFMLDILECSDEEDCRPAYGKMAGTGGAAIVAVGDDPKGEVIALCTADDHLMVFADEAERVRFVASAPIAGGCDRVIAIDRQTFAVGDAEGWELVRLRPRRGWLR
ncbi:MAG: hypothetical protein H6711_24025 [Myxococcales bacterium]|nr:hypothetical protein [Myxococcales bacterium]